MPLSPQQKSSARGPLRPCGFYLPLLRLFPLWNEKCTAYPVPMSSEAIPRDQPNCRPLGGSRSDFFCPLSLWRVPRHAPPLPSLSGHCLLAAERSHAGGAFGRRSRRVVSVRHRRHCRYHPFSGARSTISPHSSAALWPAAISWRRPLEIGLSSVSAAASRAWSAHGMFCVYYSFLPVLPSSALPRASFFRVRSVKIFLFTGSSHSGGAPIFQAF